MRRSQASKRGAERARRKARVRRARARRKRNRSVIEAFGCRAHRSCGKKTRYDTREEAELRAMFRSGRTSVDLRVYHCQYCDGWHLTHTKRIERSKGADEHT